MSRCCAVGGLTIDQRVCRAGWAVGDEMTAGDVSLPVTALEVKTCPLQLVLERDNLSHLYQSSYGGHELVRGLDTQTHARTVLHEKRANNNSTISRGFDHERKYYICRKSMLWYSKVGVIFAARCCANAPVTVMRCLCVCLSRSCILSKRIIVSLKKNFTVG